MSRIIPAIDVIDGKCVRLVEGDYQRKTTYRDDPLEVAKEFEEHGLKYLHLVDLDGAKAGKVINWRVLERICTQTQLSVDFGGGVKSNEDLQLVMDSGASQVNVGSLAVKNREMFLEWLHRYGGDKLILSADVRDGKIAIHGWQTQTELLLEDFIRDYMSQGIRTVVCTDISKDGKLQGPAIELYQQLMQQFPDLQLVASGGVSGIEDVHALQAQQMYGIIIGKAIYEGKISLQELAETQ
ncbi:MAG: 1-(5-phosphoribosyl)-5-[(5-phosphoribosylamino)methylideneamino]imidazole-4-carboxamide isomerase [Bacteroidota bacterium]